MVAAQARIAEPQASFAISPSCRRLGNPPRQRRQGKPAFSGLRHCVRILLHESPLCRADDYRWGSAPVDISGTPRCLGAERDKSMGKVVLALAAVVLLVS